MDVRSAGTRNVISAMRTHGFASPAGEAPGMSVSRRSVGRFLVEAAQSAKSVALSAA